MAFGDKIKQLRVKMNLTQDELAGRCDLSKGFISQIERDLTSPSIATLMDILESLGTNLKEFFNDAGDEKIVYRKDDMSRRDEDAKGYGVLWLIPNAQKNAMEPILLNLAVGGASEEYPPHEGEIFGYVLAGTARLTFGGAAHRLKKGESFYFRAESHWQLENNGNREARVIMASSPPNF